MNNLVSIIVPCFNQAIYLPETLDSVLAQTYPDWECIIVNDGSLDNTEIVALGYCQKDSRFKYVVQPNQGLASSRNNGIKVSHGTYILPLDADDIIKPTYVGKCVSVLDNDELCKLVYSKAEKFGVENGLWDLPKYKYEDFIWENCIFASSMYRRKDYDKTIGYNPNMKYGLEDWDFWLSLLSKEDKVVQIPECLFRYRTHKLSMRVALKNNISQMFVQIYQNHPGRYENYVPNLVVYYNNSLWLEKELWRVRSSFSYRLGHSLLEPIRFIRNYFRDILYR